MTSIFQVLLDFLDFLISPINILLYTFWCYLDQLLNEILWSLCQTFSYVINAFIVSLSYAIDFFLVIIVSIFNLFAPSGGYLSTGSDSLIGDLLNYGAVGITFVQNFVPVAALIPPFTTYIGFLITFTVYKLIKSWIPTVSGGG